MNFVPTAVILYGHDACTRLGDMLRHWDAILHENEWNQFVFIMIDRNPPLPELPARARSVLSQTILKMNPDDLGKPGVPRSIISMLRNRIQGNSICLQLVVSFHSPAVGPLENLLDWVGRIQADFETGALYTICYALLNHQTGQQTAQRALAQMLLEHGNEFPYIYLLGDYAQDGSTIQDAIMWRAMHSELLVNSSNQHQHEKNRLFSIGYSALNANNQELVAIRREAAARYLQRISERPVTPQVAWEILTQRKVPFRGLESTELFAALRLWLEQIVMQQSVFPTSEERKNNRIFTGVYQKSKSPQDIQESIRRFYFVNCGHSESVERDKESFFQKHRKDVLAQLSGLMEAGAYPLQLLDAVEKELGTLCELKPRFSIPSWDTRRMLTSHTDYINQQCEALEETLERYYRAEQLQLYAKSVYALLGNIRSFVSNAKALPGELGKIFDQTQDLKHLPAKYPRYYGQVSNVIETKPVSPSHSESGTFYFFPNGNPAADVWQKSVSAAEKSIEDTLPSECTGSFCKIIQWEYSTTEGLLRFFNNYLAGSKRMLYEAYDTPGGVQSLYITDEALTLHQWAMNNERDIVIAHNDNVERIDLFVLAKDLNWYLGNSVYFQQTEPLDQMSGEPDRLFGAFGAAAKPVETDKDAPEKPSATAPQPANSHNLQIRFTQNRYVLTWNWEPSADQAVVVISQPQGLSRSITCSLHDFNAPLYGVPNGIDITNDLPYGKVTIEIHSRRGIYAHADMTGQKRGVFYRFDRGGKGLSLRLKGQPDDIDKLLVREPRKSTSGQSILYPLQADSALGEATITGFALKNCTDCVLQPYPGDQYPTVYAERF